MDQPAHETVTRLLDAARVRTAADPVAQRVTDWASLRKRLGISPQTLTNWKARGISWEAAVDAEEQLGVSAAWVMRGRRPPGWPASNAQETPPPAYAPAAPFSSRTMQDLQQLDAETRARAEQILRLHLRLDEPGLGGASSEQVHRKLRQA